VLEQTKVLWLRSRLEKAALGLPATSVRLGHKMAAEPAWKVAGDVIIALLMLLASLPVLALAVLLIRLTSRGPPLYTQVRLGRGGRFFTLYKLRTMQHNCEAGTGPKWSVPGDPRVTPIGRLLRRSHIDELPQLWNVLRGEMSLVGPRPERPELVAILEKAIPRYRERLQVKPGLTGVAQLQMPPDTDLATVHAKIAYDLFYIQHLGLALDLRTLLGTPFYLAGIPASWLRRWLGLPGNALHLAAVEATPSGRGARPATAQEVAKKLAVRLV
jgi:lipopolysaccharide/colanic/teichoic acid biosynthesis glycosyltransferase